MRVLLIAVFCVVLAGSAQAQEKKYSQWTDPNAPVVEKKSGKKNLASFTKELDVLVDQAKKDKAADPKFLTDIRKLINRYRSPWSAAVLNDRFKDGNYTKKPTWFVANGEYWIEKDRGLRSVVEKYQVAGTDRNLSTEEKAAKILGAFLGNKSRKQETEPKPVPNIRAEDAIISTNVKVTNAFQLHTGFSSWTAPGHFEIGVYQEGGANAGYRVIYMPGEKLELVRVGSSGVRVIGTSAKPVTLEDSQKHVLRLIRTPNAKMTVQVDKKTLIRATDQSFRDAFNGVVIANRGGDYIVNQVAVRNARK